MRLGDFDALARWRVSFILATKDRAKFVARRMANLWEIVTPMDELIVINQSRNEDTLRLFREKPTIPNLTFVRDDGVGRFRAWNMGSLMARGRYIHWLADDDSNYAGALDEAVQWMDAHAEVDLTYCGGIKVVNGVENRVRPHEDYGRESADPFRYGATLAGFFMRREALAMANLFDQRLLVGDVEYMARCIMLGLNVKPLDVCIYYHPIYEHSATVAGRTRWFREWSACAELYGVKLKSRVSKGAPLNEGD